MQNLYTDLHLVTDKPTYFSAMYSAAIALSPPDNLTWNGGTKSSLMALRNNVKLPTSLCWQYPGGGGRSGMEIIFSLLSIVQGLCLPWKVGWVLGLPLSVVSPLTSGSWPHWPCL
jgi:hypothetical protein